MDTGTKGEIVMTSYDITQVYKLLQENIVTQDCIWLGTYSLILLLLLRFSLLFFFTGILLPILAITLSLISFSFYWDTFRHVA